MHKFAYTVLDRNGRPVTGAEVSLLVNGSTLAVIYDGDGTTTKTNPLTTNEDGLAECKLADGTYDLLVKYGNRSVRVNGFNYATAGGAGSIADGAVTTAKMGGDVTTAGKNLIKAANASSQRTALGLGTAATKEGSGWTNLTVGTTAPETPAVGDIWIDTN